jgi:rhamnosyltransferase
MHEQPVSIVLRSFNEAWALRDTLPALAAQRHRSWELIVFDSGSTDGSVELIHAAKPRHFVQLAPHEYRPGRVLNQGMRLALHDRVVFLNADATPQGPDWLAPLVEGLSDPGVAAVFGRQVPRPDCRLAFARDYERCFGPGRQSARWGHFFSMVSSGLRRDAWERGGFDETMQYSEDDEYSRRCRSMGYGISFIPESVVMHSHNYSPGQAFKRSFGEAWALAGVWEGPPDRFGPGRMLAGLARDTAGDLGFGLRRRCLGEWPSAFGVRCQQRLGRYHGFRTGWQMRRVDHVL